MAGTRVPWWRKALQYAIGGIRSGFGLFSRPANPKLHTGPETPAAPEENLEETALTDQIENPAQSAGQNPIHEPASTAETVAASSEELAGSTAAVAQSAPLMAEPAPPSPVKDPDLDPKAPPAEDPDDEPDEPPAQDPDPKEPPVGEPPADPENAPAPVKGVEDAAEPAEETHTEEGAEPAVPVAGAADANPSEAANRTEAASPLNTAEDEHEASGHDFSRVVDAPESMGALAPEGGTPAEPSGAEATPVAPVAPAASTSPVPDPAPKGAVKPKQKDGDADTFPISVFVGQVYDGPLDLLLDLIRKQDIDIYDIPIARITAQFLTYVNQLKASDVDVAGEFIYTASLLIHIKSKMLLPRAPAGPEDAAEDPRRELVERLLEHERFKNAAQMLQQKQMLEAATWTNPGVREFKGDAGTEPEIAADTTDLVRMFRDILERARKRPVFSVDEDQITVGQMIQFLARRLTMEDKPVALRRLLSHTRSERALIAMFLALLELVRLQAILLRQDRAFSEIFIKKNAEFESVMNERIANVSDDWR